jgi:hypothetical protein
MKIKVQSYHKFINTGEGGIGTDYLYIPIKNIIIERDRKFGIMIGKDYAYNNLIIDRFKTEKNFIQNNNYFCDYRESECDEEKIDQIIENIKHSKYLFESMHDMEINIRKTLSILDNISGKIFSSIFEGVKADEN